MALPGNTHHLHSSLSMYLQFYKFYDILQIVFLKSWYN